MIKIEKLLVVRMGLYRIEDISGRVMVSEKEVHLL